MNELSKPTAKPLGTSILGDDLDNMFQGFFRPVNSLRSLDSGDLIPPLDISENETSYTIRADIPGVKKEDIEVTLHDGLLSITASTEEKSEKKEGERVIRRERKIGRYARSLRIGDMADEADVSAGYKDGVLTVTVPKAKEVKPKKISVDVS